MLPSTLPDLRHPILQQLESVHHQQHFGKGIGPSALGNPCDRSIWYKFHWADYTTIPARITRLFERGNTVEAAIIKQLIEIGIPITGQQLKKQTAQGHITSYIDAIAEFLPDISPDPHIIEIKSANDKYFKSIRKNGIEKAMHTYFVQDQIYMTMHGIPNSLLIICNKNDDSLHIEDIPSDNSTGAQYLERGVYIINQQEPGKRIATNLQYMCTWCPYREICLENKPMIKNCRTCRYSEPIPEGKWHCNKRNKLITKLFAKKGCSKYKPRKS